MESGLRYRGILRIIDYNDAKLGNFSLQYVKNVPEKEVYFEKMITYPFAEAKKLEIQHMALPPGLAEPKPMLFDDDGEEEAAMVPPIPRPILLPDAPKPRFTITLARQIDYGFTDGCKACENPVSYTHLTLPTILRV